VEININQYLGPRVAESARDAEVPPGVGCDTFSLAESALHEAIFEPVLYSVNSLNEISQLYPEAISLGPGAPSEKFFAGHDIGRYLARYERYLRVEHGLTDAGIRRLLCQYGPTQGNISELVAGVLRCDEGIDVAAEAVVVTVGCQEALLICLLALCAKSGDVLVVPDPSYPGVLGVARLLGIEVVGVAGADGDLDLGQLSRACARARATGSRVRALYTAPDFANPVGRRLTMADRRGLLDLARQHDFIILEDSTYRFTATAPALPSLKAIDTDGRVLYLGTFAKVCMPGARVGFVVADQMVRRRDGRDGPLAAELVKVKSMTTLNTSPICQAIIGGIILENGGSLRPLISTRAERYQHAMACLLRALERHIGTMPGVTWTAPEGGFFVTMTLPMPADDGLLEISAREYGVLWTPLRPFTPSQASVSALRLSCSNLADEQIEEGVRRLARLLADLTASTADDL
jgi:(S)-3,5-dihydroxyphenylglycine transaminase